MVMQQDESSLVPEGYQIATCGKSGPHGAFSKLLSCGMSIETGGI